MHLPELEQLRIVERVPSCQCCCLVILVEQGQHGQEYQLASDFIDLNDMTVPKSYPAPDPIDICD